MLTWERLPGGQWVTTCDDGWLRLWDRRRDGPGPGPDPGYRSALAGVVGGPVHGLDRLPGALPALLGERPLPAPPPAPWRRGEFLDWDRQLGLRGGFLLKGGPGGADRGTPGPLGRTGDGGYAAHPNGTELVVWGNSRLVVWNLLTGEQFDPLSDPATRARVEREPRTRRLELVEVLYIPHDLAREIPGMRTDDLILVYKKDRDDERDRGEDIVLPLKRPWKAVPNASGPITPRWVRIGNWGRRSAVSPGGRWRAESAGSRYRVTEDEAASTLAVVGSGDEVRWGRLEVRRINPPREPRDHEFSRSGRYLVTRVSKADADAPPPRADVFDLAAITAARPFPDYVGAASFDPDGRYLAGFLREWEKRPQPGVWDAETGAGQPPPATTLFGLGTAVSRNGARALVRGGMDENRRASRVEIWELRPSRLLDEVPLQTAAAALSPDGTQAAIAESDGTIRVWTVGSPDRVSRGGPGKVTALAFGPGGDTLLAVDEAGVARFLDVRTWGQRWTTSVALANPSSAAVSSDGRLAAVGGGAGVTVLDLPTGIAVWRVPPPGTTAAVGFSADSSLLLVAGRSGQVVRWTLPRPWPDDRAAATAWVHSQTRQRFTPAGELAEIPPAELPAPGTSDAVARSNPPPDGAAWHLREADAALEAGDWASALLHLDRLLAAAPNRADLLARKARAHLGRKEWDRAIELATRALDQKPDDPNVLHTRAWASAELGDWARAVRDWEAAWRLKPEHSRYGYYLALAHLGAGDERAFRDQCRRMVERYPDPKTPAEADNVTWLAILLPDPPDLPTVEKLAERAVEQAPGEMSYLETRGAVHYRAGRYFEAVLDLRRVVDGGRASHDGRLLLALARRRLGGTSAPGFGVPLAAPIPGLGVAAADVATRHRLRAAVRGAGASLEDAGWSTRVRVRYLLREAERELGTDQPP